MERHSVREFCWSKRGGLLSYKFLCQFLKINKPEQKKGLKIIKIPSLAQSNHTVKSYMPYLNTCNTNHVTNFKFIFWL